MRSLLTIFKRGGKTASFKRDKRGATAVEFAIILPLFLFLTFGILEWSFYAFMRANLQNHLEEACRESMTNNDDNKKKDIYGNVVESREQYLDRLIARAISLGTFKGVETVVTKEVYQSIVDLNAKNKSGLGAGDANQLVKVQIKGKYKFITPMLGLLPLISPYGDNTAGPLSITTTVFVVNEYFTN
jgi:Flp pilus assembly protein TadG